MKNQLLTILLGFLFVINDLGLSISARDNTILGYHDEKANQNELDEVITRRIVNSMFAQKETADAVHDHHHDHDVRKLGLGRKKPKEYSSTMVYSMNINGKGEEEEDIDEGAAEDNEALKKSMGSLLPDGIMDDQNKEEIKTMLAPTISTTRSTTSDHDYPSNKNSNNPPKLSIEVHVKSRRLMSSTFTFTPTSRPERQISEELSPPQAQALHDHHEVISTQKKEHRKKTQKLFEEAHEEEEIVNLIHRDYKGMGHRKPPINNHEPGN